MSATPAAVRLAWSIEETAAALGIGRTAAYAAAVRGDIPTLQVGRRRLVPIAALEALLARVTASPEGAAL